MTDYPITDRNRVRQAPTRGRYDKAFVHAVLDEGYVAHVSFIADDAPMVIPMYYVRDGETLLLHGSRKARVMKVLAGGAPLAACVTHLDALVLARSAFHHSMNYRSVIVHGVARLLEGNEKWRAMDAFVNRFEPGRADLTRRANDSEDKATMVLALPLEIVSAKTRSGPPIDDDEDMTIPVRAGLIPLKVVPGDFEPDSV